MKKSNDGEVFDHEIVPLNNNIKNDFCVVGNVLDSKEEENLIDQQIDEKL